jgi:hypothetical protein
LIEALVESNRTSDMIAARNVPVCEVLSSRKLSE